MVQITEKAASELKRILAEGNYPAETNLRVGVVGGGCSGFQYSFAFSDDANQEQDHIAEQHGIKVAVKRSHDLHLDGTVIDFYEDLQQRGFKFNNPNVSRSCGCGSSFSS